MWAVKASIAQLVTSSAAIDGDRDMQLPIVFKLAFHAEDLDFYLY